MFGVGNTPLGVAIQAGNYTLAEAFLDLGADPTAGLKAPLFLALEAARGDPGMQAQGMKNVVKKLLAKGVSTT